MTEQSTGPIPDHGIPTFNFSRPLVPQIRTGIERGYTGGALREALARQSEGDAGRTQEVSRALAEAAAQGIGLSEGGGAVTWLRRVISVVFFLVPALFHTLALTWPTISVPESPQTHLLFVFANLWFANEMLRPTGRTYAALALLWVHDIIFHGWRSSLNSGIDIQDVLIFASMPLLAGLLVAAQIGDPDGR